MNGPAEWRDYWLKGKENLNAALWAHEKKQYNVCASRAYYAVFLAGIAALIKLTGFRAEDDRWNHATVQAEVSRQLIMRKKILASELGRTSMDLMELRHMADYRPGSVSAQESKSASRRAQRFLSEVGKVLGESL